MPRQARIDAPGAVHHVIVRGIERRDIFRDNQDRHDWIERLATILEETATPCFALGLDVQPRSLFAPNRPPAPGRGHAAAADRLCRQVQPPIYAAWAAVPESIQVYLVPGRSLSQRIGPLYPLEPFKGWARQGPEGIGSLPLHRPQHFDGA